MAPPGVVWGMSTGTPASDRRRTVRDLLTGLLLFVGLGLAGVGSYFHLSIAAGVSAGQCDGCAPWHPLFVVTPIVVGVATLVVAGYLGRTR